MADQEFEHFVGAQYAAVMRCVVLATGSDGAEDAVQEAFARLFARWRRVRGYERPDLWVRTVALRLARRSRGRRMREAPIEEAQEVSHTDRSPDPALQAAIATLARAQRTAIALHYFEDRSVEEIASVMGCAPSTARVHLHRGRRRLAELLDMEVDHVR
jgi:RNA polymerase sigma factor (sigma-70 family)